MDALALHQANCLRLPARRVKSIGNLDDLNRRGPRLFSNCNESLPLSQDYSAKSTALLTLVGGDSEHHAHGQDQVRWLIGASG